jgi:hypothetical protein
MTDPVVLLLTGAEAEGSAVPLAVPVEDVTLETQEAAGREPEPTEAAVEEAAATAGGEHDDVPPEPALEVTYAHQRSRTRSRSAQRQCPEPR